MKVVRKSMIDKQQIIYKFLPFAFSRLCTLFNYLNKMYKQGYKIVDIKLGCILVFEKTTIKSDYRYYILTEHFTRGRREKWNDIKFLEERNPKFFNTNGEQYKKLDSLVGIYYYIYFSKNISNDEYQFVCDYRKKYIKRANFRKFIICFWIVILYPLVMFYRHFQ